MDHRDVEPLIVFIGLRPQRGYPKWYCSPWFKVNSLLASLLHMVFRRCYILHSNAEKLLFIFWRAYGGVISLTLGK